MSIYTDADVQRYAQFVAGHPNAKIDPRHLAATRAILGGLAADGRLRSADEALAHRRRPIGGWPDGGRVTDRARTCAACGDEIWIGEHVYPADASGDTSDAAGVQCGVCEVQTRDAYEVARP